MVVSFLEAGMGVERTAIALPNKPMLGMPDWGGLILELTVLMHLTQGA